MAGPSTRCETGHGHEDQPYDWSRFTVHSYYRASRAAVYDAWSTAGGLESFFIGQAQHTSADGRERTPAEGARAGDRYSWRFLHGLELQGSFLAASSTADADRVSFTFGPMEVAVRVREVDEQVEVRLDQTGCGTDDEARAWQHLNCRSCWVYFMTNLKSVLEHGADLRDHGAPALNDAVSIGWYPDESG